MEVQGLRIGHPIRTTQPEVLNNIEVRQANGQKVYTPITNRELILPMEPDHRSEVFIRGFPHDMSATALFEKLAVCGYIYSLKIFSNHHDVTRNYAYVKFLTPWVATTACQYLNRRRFSPNNFSLRAQMVVNNNVIVIGNIKLFQYPPGAMRALIFAEARRVRRVTFFAPCPFKRYSIAVEFFDHTDAATWRRNMTRNKYNFFEPSVLLDRYPVVKPITDPVFVMETTFPGVRTYDEKILNHEGFLKLKFGQAANCNGFSKHQAAAIGFQGLPKS